MKLATGPYTLPGGGHISIPLPAATLLVRAVVIGNLTPAPVTVTIAGETSHLLPATANLFTLSSGCQGIVVTSLGTATQSGTITAEWLTPATVPGSGYPVGGAVTNLTLGADSTVKITGPVTISEVSTAVTVAGASASGQTAPTFAGRTVSAASTVLSNAGSFNSWSSVLPVPAAGAYYELHLAGAMSTDAVKLSLGASTTTVIAIIAGNSTFDFQGATLPAGAGLWKFNPSSGAAVLQLNYTVRS